MYFAMALYGLAVLIPAIFFAVAHLVIKIYNWLRWVFKD